MIKNSNIGLKEPGSHIIKFISRPSVDGFHLILDKSKSKDRPTMKMGLCSGTGCEVCDMAKIRFKNSDRDGYIELKRREKLHGYGTIDGVKTQIMISWRSMETDFARFVSGSGVWNYDFIIKTSKSSIGFPMYELETLDDRQGLQFDESNSMVFEMAKDLISDDMVVQYTKELLV